MTYPRAPLAEAVCEFRFTPTSPWDMTFPGLLYERLRADFPKKQQSATIESTVAQTPEGIRQRVQGIDRVRFSSEDEKSLIQLAPRILTVNQLAAYPGWGTYGPMIRRAYDLYREVATPDGLQRIGLRYVNHIKFAEETVNLEDFFDFYPHVGPQLPQAHGRFVCGITYLHEGERDTLRLQIASVVPELPAQQAMSLDLDYFLNAPQTNDFDVGSWLNSAHLRIESAFEGSITTRLRDRFQEPTT